MKKTGLIIVIAVIILILAGVLLFPVTRRLKDGGTVEYNAILYSVKKIRSVDSVAGGFQVGTKVRILFWNVYDDVALVPFEKTEEPVEIEETGVVIEKASEDNNVLLHIEYQPGGEMSREEFEELCVSFDVSFTGEVKNIKTGEEKQLSEEDFKTVNDYANDIIKGNKKLNKDDGCDLPAYNIKAYNDKGASYTLEANCDGWVDNADEIIDILSSYFK